jgi:AcrR family transcriptional regulator
VTEIKQLTPAGHRVLVSASEQFYRRGITAVGVAAIADVAGVTKKTLYDCFGSKSELIVAYLRQRDASWWAYLEELLLNAEPPRALVLYDAYLSQPGLDHSRGCGFINGAAELPRNHPGFEVIRAHKRAVRDKLTELVQSDQATATNTTELAEHLFLILEGAVAQVGIEGDTEPLRHARKIAESLLSRDPLDAERACGHKQT